MEQAGVPSEECKGRSPLACSSWKYGTPMKRNNVHLKRLTYQNNAQRLPFAVLPNHITPPPKLRKFITKNPFEPDLINRLHLSAISPNLFAKVSSPMQQSPEFTWNIDELAHMKPVKIEESPIQQMYSPEPELEIKAQAAIDRFFMQNQIIPSPWDIKQKGKPFLSLDTPNRFLNHFNSIQKVTKSTKDAWSQTTLSLPLELPQDVEESLKPFFTFTQEQNADFDDANLSNNSLRRKLFVCQDESIDNDNESFTSLSPVKTSESMVLVYSPPQSGMFVHGTPLKMLLETRRQSNGSSVIISENLSPNISPIHNAENNKLYKRIEHCSSLATRLNFATDMNTNDAAERKSSSSINDHHSLDVSDSENDMKCIEDNGKWIIIDNDRTNACDSVNMEETKSINSPDNTVYSNATVLNDDEYNETSSKIAPEITSFSRKSHKQSNIMSGAFEQQNISNSVQDTGYQTHSMNSMMHTIDSCNTSMSQKTLWNERIMSSRDIGQLSWKENMTNVFSSTPSKYNKERESGT